VEVEMELDIPVKNNITFVGYIDLVLREKETGKIKILDFKTSSNGWNAYQKDDYTKTSQLILYKAFYSKRFGVPLNHIDVEFFILKRKLYAQANFPQSRIQVFSPPSSNPIVSTVIGDLVTFINESFTAEGTYIENVKNYPKNPGKDKKNCKYCVHKKVNCDQKETRR
jgi:hypothetical protein